MTGAVAESSVTGYGAPGGAEPVPRRPKLDIRPLKVTEWDPAMQVSVRRTYGHRAECDCGWTGDKHRTVALARFDGACHLAEEHE